MIVDTPELYDKHFIEHPERWADPQEVDYLIKEILDAEYGSNFANIIDIGCGQGRTIGIIKKPEWSIVGIDWSKEALAIAKKNNPEDNISFINEDINEWQHYDFRCALSIGTHEHIKKISFYKIADGLLDQLSDEPCKGLFLCVLPTFLEDQGWGQTGPQWEWKLTREEWIRHLEGDGFTVDTNVLHKDLFVCRITTP